MVEFFYSLDYDEVEDTEKNGVSPLQLHARMFAIGDRFDIPDLRVVAVQKYLNRCSLSWDDLEFLGSIREIYTSTPDSIPQLRNAAVSVAWKKARSMQDTEGVRKVYEEVTKEVPEFTRHLLSEYVNHGVNESSWKKRKLESCNWQSILSNC